MKIIFAPICGGIFTLSFENMLILDWTSPLKRVHKSAQITFASLRAITAIRIIDLYHFVHKKRRSPNAMMISFSMITWLS